MLCTSYVMENSSQSMYLIELADHSPPGGFTCPLGIAGIKSVKKKKRKKKKLTYYFYVRFFILLTFTYENMKYESMKILPLWTTAYNLRSYQTAWIKNNMSILQTFDVSPILDFDLSFLQGEIKEYQRLKSSTFIVA